MGTPLAAFIPATPRHPQDNDCRLALAVVVPLFLPVANSGLVPGGTSGNEQFSRVLERRHVSSGAQDTFLDCLHPLFRDRGLRSLHACVDGSNETLVVECTDLEYGVSAGN